MRVRAVHRYFWPDTPPYASFLREIAGRWHRDGHEVTVISAQPGYTSSVATARRPPGEELDGFTVERVHLASERGCGPRQLANLLLFPASVALRLIRGPRPDVVMCSTAPQVTLGVAVSLAARALGADFVYHCMDLHPEIGRLSGEFANPRVYSFLARLDLATMRRASRIIVLSEDMRRAVLARDPGLAGRVIILNNYSLPDGGEASASPLPPPAPGVCRVVFTGNLGRFQGLEDIVTALGTVPAGVRLELVFMGEGKAKEAVRAAAQGLGDRDGIDVVLLPHGPASSAKSLMRSAHLGVVSLVPGVVRYAYPSKTATYAEESLPMLVVCEPDAQLARETTRLGLGWAVAPGDIDGIAMALTQAADELARGTFDTRRDRVRRHAAAFDRDVALGKWSQLLRQLEAERNANGTSRR